MLIPTVTNVKTITDMREDALGLLDRVQKEGLTYIFHRSKPRAVLMDIDSFAQMQKLIEDYEDFLSAKKVSGEKRGAGIPIEAIAKRYEL